MTKARLGPGPGPRPDQDLDRNQDKLRPIWDILFSKRQKLKKTEQN